MKFDEMAKFEKPVGLGAPESVDWVQEGAVSSVKQQGNCGSCWTFSVTGALEGAMKIAGHDLVELSQQMLLNCDWGMLGGHGCSGGNPVQAFGWVKSNGLCSSADYPYKCVNKTADKCRNAKCDKNTCTRVLKADNFLHRGGDVTAFASVGQTEGELEAAVAQQPVSVAIEADTEIFQHYTGGILESDACGQNIDHAVLVVGYGIQKGFFSGGKKYWKVKNSWGAQWGEEGYVKIAKGKTSGYGECGIRTFASFPTVKPKAAEIVV
jgi:C1A family cysteine protease